MPWNRRSLCPTVLSGLCVKDCEAKNVQKLISDMTDKRAISKPNWNVERLVGNMRVRVAWDLSCECWVERNVKCYEMLVVKSEAKLLDILGKSGTLRANICVCISRWLIHYLQAPRPANYIGKKFLLILSTITHFGNIPVCSQQNR